jgi:hypothetical protein
MIDPQSETPLSIRKELTTYGGNNPFKRPMWRMVIAERCLGKRGGIFNTFTPGTTLTDFQPDGRFQHIPLKPISTRSGVFDVRIYPVKGWILERWFPPSMIGTKEWWESQKGADGSPLLGDYPHEGLYWMISGPWKQLPNVQELKDKIRRYEYAMDINSGDFDQRMKEYVASVEAEEEKEFDDYAAQRQYAIRHIVQPILKTASVGASRLRQELVKDWGHTSHVQIGG